ncbi:MAG: hypothetical protein ACYST0_02095, partial [Planctomycetota bacterium]
IYLSGSTSNDPASNAGWFPTTPDALRRDPTASSGGGGGGNGRGKKNTGSTTVFGSFFLRLGLDPQDQLQLQYSTLIGGSITTASASDLVFDIQVVNARAYLAGRTGSGQLPIANPVIDTAIGLTGDQLSGEQDAFVMALDFTAFAPGQVAPTLAFSSHFGGDTQDAAKRLHVDSGGRIFLLGGTNVEPKRKGKNLQKEYPQKGTPQYKSRQDFRDGFFTILEPAGNSYSVAYSTLFGGNDYDNIRDFALGPDGHVHLLWSTQSTDLTVTPNAWLATKPYGWSGFLMKIPWPVAGN